jgi:hypothetical protein
MLPSNDEHEVAPAAEAISTPHGTHDEDDVAPVLVL